MFISFDEFCKQEEIEIVTETVLDKVESRPWSDDQYPIVARWLDANRAALDVVTEASCKDRFYIPLLVTGDVEQPTVFDAMLSHLPFSRKIGRALLIRANCSIASGETDTAWSDILAVKRLGRLVADEPILISHLIGQAMDADATKAIAILVSETELNADSAGTMSAELASLNSFTTMLEALSLVDRFMMLDLAQRDIVNWLPSALPQPTILNDRKIELLAQHYDPNVLLRAINKEHDHAQLAFKMDAYADASEYLDDQSKRWSDMYDAFVRILEGLEDREVSPRTQYLVSNGFVPLLTPSFRGANDVIWTIRVNHDFERIALAIAAHRADHGDYPLSLNDLIPEYINAIPPDRFNDEPLHYTRTEDGGARVWSVGPDLDDNGGDEDSDVVMTLW